MEMSDDDFDGSDEGIKSLRKAYEKLQAKLAETEEANAKLAVKERTRSIADKLKDLGAKPGLAEFVPPSVEVEGLGQWLTEKADLFGFKFDQPDEPAENAAEAESQKRISGFSSEQSALDQTPELTALQAVTTKEQLDELLYRSLAGNGPR